jgi:hypothetical protein
VRFPLIHSSDSSENDTVNKFSFVLCSKVNALRPARLVSPKAKNAAHNERRSRQHRMIQAAAGLAGRFALTAVFLRFK